jgi:putative PIN family toxin of toxin-antitoxin system
MQNSKLRIVPDTGFYIAAALKDGFARSYLVGKGSKLFGYELFTSEAILLEVQTKLEDKFGFGREEVVKVIQDIRRVATVVYPKQKLTVIRDPDDNKILECAVEAEAHIVAAFDKDLLDLKEYEGIKVAHPSKLSYWFPRP